MGASFVNFHLRTADEAAVVHACEELVSTYALISPPKGDWVTVYDESSDGQDPGEIDRLAHDLSLTLHAPLLAFLVHDSSLFVYYLFDEEGCLIDEYNSAPEHYGEEARSRFA